MKEKGFKEFLEFQKEKSESPSEFCSLLFSPLQRISVYSFLMEMLIKYTLKDNFDFQELKTPYSKIGKNCLFFYFYFFVFY